MTPLVAYYRVSTQRQGASGLGLDAQRAAVRAYARQRKAKIVAEYTEVESGRKSNRPHLAAAVERAREHGAAVVVAKLDRLSRDAKLVLDLIDQKVKLVFLDIPEADATTAAGEMVIGILAVIARFESNRIGERIRSALKARRDRGLKHKGVNSDPNLLKRACRAAGKQRQQAAREYRARTLPLIEPMRAKGYTLERMCDRLNARGLLTFSGKKWTVANLERFAAQRS